MYLFILVIHTFFIELKKSISFVARFLKKFIKRSMKFYACLMVRPRLKGYWALIVRHKEATRRQYGNIVCVRSLCLIQAWDDSSTSCQRRCFASCSSTCQAVSANWLHALG